MSANDHMKTHLLSRYKNHLGLIAIASLAILALCIVLLGEGSGALEDWQFGLILLPLVSFFISFILVTYENWFGPNNQSQNKGLFILSFWILALSMLGIVIALYSRFVFS